MGSCTRNWSYCIEPRSKQLHVQTNDPQPDILKALKETGDNARDSVKGSKIIEAL